MVDMNGHAYAEHGASGAHGEHASHGASGPRGIHDVLVATEEWLAFTSWDAALLAALVAALAGYVLLARRARGGAGRFERGSALAFVLGLGTVFAAGSSPFLFLKEGSHLGFMLQLELMMNVAPPLLLLGLRPVRGALPKENGSLVGPRTVSVPVLTLGVWLATVYAWHVPALHMLGIHSRLADPIQLASYVAAGLLFWWAVLRTVDRPGGMSLSAKLGYLALAQLGAAPLAALLIFYPEVVYAHGAITRPFGLSALVDQKVSGAVMMVVDMTVASTVAGWIVLRELGARIGDGSSRRSRPAPLRSPRSQER